VFSCKVWAFLVSLLKFFCQPIIPFTICVCILSYFITCDIINSTIDHEFIISHSFSLLLTQFILAPIVYNIFLLYSVSSTVIMNTAPIPVHSSHYLLVFHTFTRYSPFSTSFRRRLTYSFPRPRIFHSSDGFSNRLASFRHSSTKRRKFSLPSDTSYLYFSTSFSSISIYHQLELLLDEEDDEFLFSELSFSFCLRSMTHLSVWIFAASQDSVLLYFTVIGK